MSSTQPGCRGLSLGWRADALLLFAHCQGHDLCFARPASGFIAGSKVDYLNVGKKQSKTPWVVFAQSFSHLALSFVLFWFRWFALVNVLLFGHLCLMYPIWLQACLDLIICVGILKRKEMLEGPPSMLQFVSCLPQISLYTILGRWLLGKQ